MIHVNRFQNKRFYDIPNYIIHPIKGEYMFNPELRIGEIITNADIVSTFKCGNMGGMRRSKKTNTLVLISDYTKGLYHDKWIGDVLHYTGMGKIGNQDIDWAQNATLANSKHNGVDVHLFEVMDSGKYIYCGRVELVSAPYIDIQIDENGTRRNVWIFPIQPTPKNDVIKPTMFVFPDMESYQKNKSATETAYYKKLRATKKGPSKKSLHTVRPTSALNASSAIPHDIIGKQIHHTFFGRGTVISIENASIIIQFETEGTKKIGYAFSMEKNLLTLVEN